MLAAVDLGAMRLICAGILLVVSLTPSEIDRALAIARAREPERQQFHKRYVIELPDPAVTQIEITTEFRRLVLIAEEHVARGDFMFTRGVREAQAAITPFRGLVTVKARVRFNPLNTFINPPPYELAMGTTSAGPQPLETVVTPEYSVPFKDTRTGKDLSSLIGATLEATLNAERLGQSSRVVAVTLDGKELARAVIDFQHLD